MDNQIDDLLNSASSQGNLGSSDFDVFLSEHSFNEDDISKRIYMDDLFAFYCYWYYNKYNKIPHRSTFTIGSVITKIYRIRMSHPINKGKLAWGLKCSVAFRISYLQYKKDATEWQTKLKKLLGSQSQQRAKRINRQEQRQLERLLSIQDSTQNSSQE